MAKNESKNENKVKKHFFKDFKAELKKVIWPSPKQLVNNTVAVVTIVLITAVIVVVLDGIFKFGSEYLITPGQNWVNEKFNSKEENKTESENKEDDASKENESTGENTTSDGNETVEDNTTTTTENAETPVENTAQ